MRVLLLDHELFRLGLRLFLEAASDCDVVGEASTVRDALRIVGAAEPDVVVLDTALLGLRAVSAIRKIRHCRSDIRVLVLTEHGLPRDVVVAMTAGASGYALKGDDNREILAAIRRVSAGGLYLSPAIDLGPPYAAGPSPTRHDQVVDVF